MGRFRFKEHLAQKGLPGSVALLAFYQDSSAYLKIMQEFQSLSLAIHGVSDLSSSPPTSSLHTQS